jgi:hypothetical protein
MAQTRNIKTDEFDSLIIGGGLSGLLVANQLENTGRKVALVESMESLGGNCRAIQTKAGLIDHGFKFFPDNENTREILTWVSKVTGEKIDFEVVDAPPVTYDDGRFKPFVGFGDQKVETAAEVDAYAKTQYLRLSSTPKDWIRRLTETFTGTLLTQSQATKMQIDDHFVIEVLINGAKRLSGREVVFCATPQQLTRLLPDANAPGRLRQKLLKGEFWTSVNLNLVHSTQVTESTAVHVLKGAGDEPSFGIFHPAQPQEGGRMSQVSQWMTLVPRDVTDEAELTASAYRQIKRQLKRAYENSLDNLLQEHIALSPTSHGDFMGFLGEDGKWPKLENLWVVSGFLDAEKNTVGALRQARRTLTSLIGEVDDGILFEDSESPQRAHPNA